MAQVPQREFLDLVKAIGESKSKQEEDRIVAEEVHFLKKKIPEQGVPKKKMKELIIRAMYVEMLGQDASFAYIKAVELCASTNILQKRAGYLVASLCLAPEHEFRFMLVNQIQRDLNSSNHLETIAAIAATCKLITVDMIPAVINDITKLLRHENDIVRKKAVCALHRFYQLDQSSISNMGDKVRRALCDKDPSVMAASLCLLHDLIRDNPNTYKDLVSSFVSILKQITEHRLPREFDYHRQPAPWIQMHLLRILAMVGKGDQVASEGMYEVLVDVMRRADTGINIGYAVVYECVRTITTIYPNNALLDAAASSISRFIRSENHNLKYIGVKGLALIVKDHPRYAADHPVAVIECLEDPDETLKHKTLDLLFRMTNPQNVEFIVEKLLHFLSQATDDFFRSDLVSRITQCAERYAPNNTWYVQTMIRVFELAGEKVQFSVAQTLMQLVAEGTGGDDEEGDLELRVEAVESLIDLMDKPSLPDVLVQCMAWILGEYGYLSETMTKEEIIDKLCTLSTKNFTDLCTRGYVLTAIFKLVAQTGSCPTKVTSLVSMYADSKHLDIAQRCREFKTLMQYPDVMVSIVPVDASCEDLEVDENLEFLESIVQQALAEGKPPYSPPTVEDDDELDERRRSQLKITPYAKPSAPAAATHAAFAHSTPAAASIAPSGAQIQTPALQAGLNLRGVQQVWGRKPTGEPAAPVANQTAQPAAAAAASTTAPAAAATPAAAAATTTAPATAAAKSTYTYGSQTPPKEPQKTKEELEKERLASQLFAGLTGGSAGTTASASAARTRRTTRRTTAKETQSETASPPPSSVQTHQQAQPTSPASAPAAAPVAAAPAPAPAPAPAVSGAALDLLDLSFDMPATTQPVTPTPAPFGDVLAPVSPLGHQAPVTSPTAHSHSSISDAFATLSVADPLVPGMVGMAAAAAAAAFTYNGQTVMPLTITTQDFGGRWGRTAGEKKARCATRLKNLEQLRQRVVGLPAHHIESIQQTVEAIYAASLMPMGTPILIHVKLNSVRGLADVTVRSPDPALSDAVCVQLQQLLA